MEIVTHCFVVHKSALTQCLLRENFSYDQVLQFLPNAASAIYEATQITSLYETMACLMAGCSYDADSKINIDSIAEKSGLDNYKVAIGLNAIAPILLPAFAHKANYELPTSSVVTANLSPGNQEKNVA